MLGYINQRVWINFTLDWTSRSAETFSSAIRSAETKNVTLTFGLTFVLVLTWD